MENSRTFRLTPCPTALKEIIGLANEVPPDSDLFDIQKQFADLENQYSQFINTTAGVEEFDDESYPDLRSSASNTESWIHRLLELHRQMTWALRTMPAELRVRLWEEALMPGKGFKGNLGPNGELSDEAAKSQSDLAHTLAPRLAGDPVGNSLNNTLSALSEFMSQSPENPRLYFWALCGLVKKYSLIHEYRTNLNKVVNIGALNPDDRLTYARILDPIGIRQEYTVNERGKFVQVRNPFTDAFEDDDIDVTRIRRCDNCRKIFWAGRRDQMCCTPTCNHARHSKRTREKRRARLIRHK